MIAVSSPVSCDPITEGLELADRAADERPLADSLASAVGRETVERKRALRAEAVAVQDRQRRSRRSGKRPARDEAAVQEAHRGHRQGFNLRARVALEDDEVGGCPGLDAG